jgi:hypothetical protein
MGFKEWLVDEGSRELAKAYSDALRDVPENPEHHPEGTTLKHVKLVRRAVLGAAEELRKLKSDPSFGDVLANIDFSLSYREVQILNLAAWLHDIGKATATTIGGLPFRNSMGARGKIQAIGHERPDHYSPQIDMLRSVAPESLVRLYDENRDLVNFLIERHMDFAHGGFPNHVIADFFDNGRLKNDQRMKLLLVLMWADKMGRAKEPNLEKSVARLKVAAEKSRRAVANTNRRSDPFSGNEEEFRSMLKSRGLDQASIDAASEAKFPKV